MPGGRGTENDDLIIEGEVERVVFTLGETNASLFGRSFLEAYRLLGVELAANLGDALEIRFGALHTGFASSLTSHGRAPTVLFETVGWIVDLDAIRDHLEFDSYDGQPLSVQSGAPPYLKHLWYSPRKAVLSSVAPPAGPTIGLIICLMEDWVEWRVAIGLGDVPVELLDLEASVEARAHLEKLANATSWEGFLLAMSGVWERSSARFD